MLQTAFVVLIVTTSSLGEAEYIYDMPTVGGDLYAAFVIAKLGPAALENLDISEALVRFRRI